MTREPHRFGSNTDRYLPDDAMTAPVWTPERARVAGERAGSARPFAQYHAAQARFGGASWEFHARADTWVQSVSEDLTAALAEIERLTTEVHDGRDLLHAACAQREARSAELEQALRELVRAASDTANQHGCSGDLGARLSDARTALAGTARVESALRDLGSEYTSPAGWEDAIVAAKGACLDCGRQVSEEDLRCPSCAAQVTDRVTLTDKGRAALRGEVAKCDLCVDTDAGELFLRGRCHPTAPLRAVLDGDVLTLRCYVPECDRFVASFRFAPVHGKEGGE